MFTFHVLQISGLFLLLAVFCYASALPADLQLPSLPVNLTDRPLTVFDLGLSNITAPPAANDRPTRYRIPVIGDKDYRITLYLNWHLTRFQQRETDLLMLRTLDRLVQTALTMTKGDEPILDGRIVFRSAGLALRAQDKVLLGGLSYGVLATAVRGLGELLHDYGANGVGVDVYASGKLVGNMDLDVVI